MILFENLFKPGQPYPQPQNSVLSTASFLACSLIFIETSFLSDALVLIAYNQKEKFSPEKHIE
ncbi:Uncharacterised protein [Streptococcus pneumoniae]|uniref:hypothetical protein n=1 Tax=Streptococcus pneumoniae TaxID=1313 RepID=UPI000B597F5D|nr:hypothetical protein [Streptococcus pneumoniae]SNJ72392.1 Uncharacterised protein [Streptococcus pneumoniae]